MPPADRADARPLLSPDAVSALLQSATTAAIGVVAGTVHGVARAAYVAVLVFSVVMDVLARQRHLAFLDRMSALDRRMADQLSAVVAAQWAAMDDASRARARAALASAGDDSNAELN